MANKKRPSQFLVDAELEERGETLLKLHGGVQRLADLVCCGLESGTYATFGVDCDQYVAPVPENLFRMDDDGPHVYKHIQYPCSVGGSAALFCRHEDDDKRFTLDLPALKRGLARLQLDFPHLFAEWVKENEDAIVGDALLQCAVLGDIVYG